MFGSSIASMRFTTRRSSRLARYSCRPAPDCGCCRLLLQGGAASLKALKNAPRLSAQADDGIVVHALALNDQALKALALNRQTGSCADQREIGLGKPVEPAEIGPVDLTESLKRRRWGERSPRGRSRLRFVIGERLLAGFGPGAWKPLADFNSTKPALDMRQRLSHPRPITKTGGNAPTPPPPWAASGPGPRRSRTACRAAAPSRP